jgi:glycosyltransferase involved in cell wall biosynthesis
MKLIKIRINNDENKKYVKLIKLKRFKLTIANEKYSLKLIIQIVLELLFLYLIFKFNLYIIENQSIDLKYFYQYIHDCETGKIYNQIKIKKDEPYISICIAALNMEKYIKRNLLSIINQSFQDFEIIVINDFSHDNTPKIIQNIQESDERIKIINHPKKLGVYKSRIEAILIARGKYILIMDPDDMFLNKNLFRKLYCYSSIFNLDIVEFSVYHQNEGEKNIFVPDNHFESHYHQFPKNIIYQPELSDLLFYKPGTKEVSKTICRNIWNKIIKRQLFLKMHNWIGMDYYNSFILIADDMIMNIILYQYAQSYSNINLSGYLYNIRKLSVSRGDGGIELKRIRTISHYKYFKLFYRFVKEFNKDRNYLFFEMKDLNHYVYYIKDLNIKEYIQKQINFVKYMLEDKSLSQEFRNYLMEILNNFSQVQS